MLKGKVLFIYPNKIGDGIMRKNQINAGLTEYEIRRNKMVSKVRYKIEQYFGITEKYHGAGKARFTTILKENWNHLYGAMAFNIKRVILTKRKQEVMAAVCGIRAISIMFNDLIYVQPAPSILKPGVRGFVLSQKSSPDLNPLYLFALLVDDCGSGTIE